MTLFFLQPVAIGCWLALIPFVKETLELSKAELSIALLGSPVALLVALQIAGKAVGLFGVRKLFLYAFPLQAAASVLPIVAINQLTLFLGLAAFGAAIALMEVALNVYAGRIEKKAARLIMNRCHGFWALGLMTGSLVVSLMAGALSPLGAMMFGSFATAIIGFYLALGLPKVGEEDGKGTLPRRKLSELPRSLFLIAIFMFAITLTEGAMADWAAVYLSERMESSLTDAAIAVTVFSGFLAAGRFAGDWLKYRFGALVHARGSIATTVLGLLLLILPLPLPFVFVGFACVGLGVASGYPLGVSAVAALDDVYEAGNVALMSTAALMGFLVGPPLIGFLSEAFGLRVGFTVMIPGLLAAFAVAHVLQPRESSQNEE
ncbi:MAG: MFS transporter [Silicimonas sp.]|nr:MFS transporter [Silicimonas sp.]